MMNTNSDTVLKLSEALNNLINAYEELQNENNEIKEKNENLQKQLSELTDQKDSLETNFEELNENTEKQETNINSMLGKIESLLGVKSEPKKEIKDIIVEEPEKPAPLVAQESIEIEHNIFNTPIDNEMKSDTKKEDDSLDLNRMASLLNGFNK